MKSSIQPRFLLLIALCGLTILTGCAGSSGGNNFSQSSGTPVNPETDPGGQGVAGSRSTGANNRQTPGRP